VNWRQLDAGLYVKGAGGSITITVSIVIGLHWKCNGIPSLILPSFNLSRES
jgi:hypothetical protein